MTRGETGKKTEAMGTIIKYFSYLYLQTYSSVYIYLKPTG